MKLLENKVALVTGATRGIGKKIAEIFADNGADIAFTYQNSDEKANELEKKLTRQGTKVKAYKVDASDFEGTNAMVQDSIKTFEKIDILINNAGITQDNLLIRMSLKQWEEVIKVNLNSAFNYTKALSTYFLKQRQGSIINISSVVGISGNAGQANYAASKAGLIGFTKSIAKELGSRNIRCNAIAPGFIATEMTQKIDEKVVKSWTSQIPMKRAGIPEDVANTALFLGSDLSKYISGQVINVCGGMQT